MNGDWPGIDSCSTAALTTKNRPCSAIATIDVCMYVCMHVGGRILLDGPFDVIEWYVYRI